jgi:hypothetical protein
MSMVKPMVEKFKKEASILKYLSGRSQHFIRLKAFEYKRKENIGFMIMEQGQPLNDSLRRSFWKQIVAILSVLDDANIGRSTKDKR